MEPRKDRRLILGVYRKLFCGFLKFSRGVMALWQVLEGSRGLLEGVLEGFERCHTVVSRAYRGRGFLEGCMKVRVFSTSFLDRLLVLVKWVPRIFHAWVLQNPGFQKIHPPKI